MVFQQFYLNCLAHASYLIGDERTRTAAVVDPQRDIDQYVALADAHGLRIAHVFLTHFHADFIAGHLELRDRCGATIYLGAAASAEYAFTPLADGDRVAFGDVVLETIATPGHTPESISIAVYDLARTADAPQAVLTGDTLFVGDVGRPDLRVALGWKAADLGGLLYDSLHDKLLALPDASLVYPAHGAGSLCGKAISKETVSTIGEQRRSNYALQPMTKAEFVDLVTTDQPDAPAYFTYDAVLNSRERPTLSEALARELTPLSAEAVLALHEQGADVLDHSRPIVIIADPGHESEAAIRLGRIGFDQVAGFLDGGLSSLALWPDRSTTTERISPAVAAERLALPEDLAPILLDVRTAHEREQKSIRGSVPIPLSQLAGRLDELSRARPILVHCAGGYRSSIAASLLQRAGFPTVSELAGGIAAWETARLPTMSRSK